MTIKYILFDLDNTLVLSEHIALGVCAELLNNVCASKGVTLAKPYTVKDLLSEFVGQNYRSMLQTVFKKHNVTGVSEGELEGYIGQELHSVIAAFKTQLRPCPGAMEALERVSKEGKYGMAIVSSSALPRVKASTEIVGMTKYFPADRQFSAASSMPVPTSKPDPAIYTFACAQIGVNPAEAVAVEDSATGTKSAVAAGIPLIGYVGAADEEDKAELREKLVAAGAVCIMESWDEFEAALAQVEKVTLTA